MALSEKFPIWAGVILAFTLSLVPSHAFEPCKIRIVEKGSGWPVPLVELKTTHSVTFVSDNAGVIAFDLPELMGEETWFEIEGHGYGVPKDGFGNRGLRLTPEPGKTLTVEVERELPAKRLGRISGAGLFGESQRFDEETNWKDQGILGCDSVQTAVHKGKLYWAWGDTTLARYPLGLFHMLGATTELKALDSFEPPVRLRYDYFKDDAGKPRVICEMAGAGPTWSSGFASLPDKEGNHRLVCAYVKIKPPLAAYESGLCVWNEEEQKFEKLKTLWTKSEENKKRPPAPEGHPVFWTDAFGKKWILFGDPFPTVKCAATFEAWSDPESWQILEPQETVLSATGDIEVKHHRGSIAWSDYRKKWVAIFSQIPGESSMLGEIWYAEAKSPMGPWEGAIKVVTHNKYTFYNPHLHPEFVEEDSPILLFEATYTKSFSGNEVATPRYDYNQVLYRLDLDEIAPVKE